MKKIAVILCGSGYKDGSEIRESVGVLWALSRHPVEVQCFAPDAAQADVVNCLTGETVTGESRNMLVEAARIARGKVKPLSELQSAHFNAVIVPGGFGVAKNLCTFAQKGHNATVLAGLEKILREFHSSSKPIGAICIAPAVVALSLEGKALELTVGATSEASQEIERLGHRHVVCQPDSFHWDAEHKIATSPAYMYEDAPLHRIFLGIQKAIDQVVQFA